MAYKRKMPKTFAKSFFQFLLWITILSVVAFGGLKVMTQQIQQDIIKQEEGLNLAKKKLEAFGNQDSHQRLDKADYINDHHQDVPWTQRIEKVVTVLQTLQKINYEWSEAITLYDFSVSLDQMRLKGETSALKLLYYTSENRNYTSLLELFQNLDFVEHIEVKEYRTHNDMIEFSLLANLNLKDVSF